ncbi:MAG: Fe-S cluster assembly protein SufD, partial [Prochlorothrix sp.]
MAPKTSAEKRSAYLTQLLDLGQSIPTEFPESIARLQRQAAARIPELAIPSTRHEDWRFTDLSALMQLQLQATANACSFTLGQLEALLLPEAPHRLVFVDGIYVPSLSATAGLPSGVTIGNIAPGLAQQPGSDEVFTTLTTASFHDIAWIHLAADTILEAPIQLLWISTLDPSAPIASFPRALVLADRCSSLQLVEDFVTLGQGCT